MAVPCSRESSSDVAAKLMCRCSIDTGPDTLGYFSLIPLEEGGDALPPLTEEFPELQRRILEDLTSLASAPQSKDSVTSFNKELDLLVQKTHQFARRFLLEEEAPKPARFHEALMFESKVSELMLNIDLLSSEHEAMVFFPEKFLEVAKLRFETEDIPYGKKLGEGGYSIVHALPKGLAVKRARSEFLEAGIRFRQREMNVTARLERKQSEILCPQYTVVTSSGQLEGIYKRAECTLEESKPLTIYHLRLMLHDVLKGLEVLHEKKVAHRDLRSANIFHLKSGRWKLGDLGSVCGIGETKAYAPYFSPPEFITGDDEGKFAVTDKADMWQIGLLAFKLLTKGEDFQVVMNRSFPLREGEDVSERDLRSYSGMSSLFKAMSEEPDAVAAVLEEVLAAPSASLGENHPVLQIMRSCLSLDPDSRLSAVDALKHL